MWCISSTCKMWVNVRFVFPRSLWRSLSLLPSCLFLYRQPAQVSLKLHGFISHELKVHYFHLLLQSFVSTVTLWSEPVQPSHTRCKPSSAGNQTTLKRKQPSPNTSTYWGREGKAREGKSISYLNLHWDRAHNLIPRSKVYILWLIH